MLAGKTIIVCETVTVTHMAGGVVSGVRHMNARRARLVPGWVTVFGRVYHLGIQQAN